MTKTYEETYELMQQLASNHHQMVYDRTVRKSTFGVLQMDAFNAISTQIVALSKQMRSLEVQSQANAQMEHVISYEFCGSEHFWDQCSLQVGSVNYIGNFNRSKNNLYSNTYNPGWRNHPNFGWGGNQYGWQKPETKPQASIAGGTTMI